MHADLAASPDDVIDGERPFLAHEMLDLALIEPAAEIHAEIGGLARIAEHRFDLAAVPQRKPVQQLWRQMGSRGDEARHERQ